MAWPGLTVEQRRMVRRLSEEGLSLRQVGAAGVVFASKAWLVLRGQRWSVGAVGVGTG